MKLIAHLALAVCLLLQGAMALAMQLPQVAKHPVQKVMPCHEMASMAADTHPAAMSCCERAGKACEAVCAAPALPVRICLASMPRSESDPTSALGSGVLQAHRADPLRPPIDLSV